ncbi:MAG: hypothetical protein E7671_03925 [Ruminococcaceae bacterium]|nr:hypothetical protein [Oscillospiraceae bacterium]
MKKNDIKRVLSSLDSVELPKKEEIFPECYEYLEKRPVRHHGLGIKGRIILITLAVAILGTLVGCAAEIKEYNDAVDFFEEHFLSLGGLSRSEIKKIYRDIKTERFVYEKTADVLSNTVVGYELLHDSPTPEELKEVWDKLEYYVPSGVTYEGYIIDGGVRVKSGTPTSEVVFEKHVNGEKVWERILSIPYAWIDNYSIVGDGEYIAVHGGITIETGPFADSHAFIELLDADSGESQWRKVFNEYDRNFIVRVLDTDDGMTVFSRGNLVDLIFSKLDMQGNVLYKKTSTIGIYGYIQGIVKFGEEYLILIDKFDSPDKILKISSDGEIVDTFSYTSEDMSYFLYDMIGYGGKIYISAYAIPKEDKDVECDSDVGLWRYSIIHENRDLFEVKVREDGYQEYTFNGIHEKLLEVYQENHYAVLLVCDSDTGVPSEFYSVPSSLCGKFAISDKGEMIWNTEYISDVKFAPEDRKLKISGATNTYRHTFNRDGMLISVEKTGEVSKFTW